MLTLSLLSIHPSAPLPLLQTSSSVHLAMKGRVARRGDDCLATPCSDAAQAPNIGRGPVMTSLTPQCVAISAQDSRGESRTDSTDIQACLSRWTFLPSLAPSCNVRRPLQRILPPRQPSRSGSSGGAGEFFDHSSRVRAGFPSSYRHMPASLR